MTSAGIHQTLDEIIKTAYEKSTTDQKKRYLSYRLDISDTPLLGSNGTYTIRDKTICIYDPGKGVNHLIKSCLHELAHHLDYTRNKMTGHQRTFYEEYTRLVYAALDLGLLSRQDFETEGDRDREKLQKILSEYVPRPKKKAKLIKVKNSYKVKDDLRRAGYKWNDMEQAWEKEYDRDFDTMLMDSLGIENTPSSDSPWYTIAGFGDKPDMTVNIVAYGNAYAVREILKEHKFHFDQERKNWIKKVYASQVQAELEALEQEMLAREQAQENALLEYARELELKEERLLKDEAEIEEKLQKILSKL